MILGYYRLGKYEDARRSMKRILEFARRFRMDNPLTKFGSDVYQPNEPINLTYDAFGPPAAMVRGLFEYLYRADGLTLVPHIPPGIKALEQRFPIRFGRKRLFLSTVGSGNITAVEVNSKRWKLFDAKSVFLPYDKTPDTAHICIALGGAKPRKFTTAKLKGTKPSSLPKVEVPGELAGLSERIDRLREFHARLVKAGLGESYEAAHAKLALEFIAVTGERLKLLTEGKLQRLPEPSQTAADKSYMDTAVKLCDGLEKVLQAGANSDDPHKKRVYQIWTGQQ